MKSDVLFNTYNKNRTVKNHSTLTENTKSKTSCSLLGIRQEGEF